MPFASIRRVALRIHPRRDSEDCNTHSSVHPLHDASPVSHTSKRIRAYTQTCMHTYERTYTHLHIVRMCACMHATNLHAHSYYIYASTHTKAPTQHPILTYTHTHTHNPTDVHPHSEPVFESPYAPYKPWGATCLQVNVAGLAQEAAAQIPAALAHVSM